MCVRYRDFEILSTNILSTEMAVPCGHAAAEDGKVRERERERDTHTHT